MKAMMCMCLNLFLTPLTLLGMMVVTSSQNVEHVLLVWH